MDYKKPAFWIVAAAVLLCIVLAGCLTANPLTDSSEWQPQAEYKNQDDYLKAIDIAQKSVKTEKISVDDKGSNEQTAQAWMEAWFDMYKALPEDNMAYILDGEVDSMKITQVSKEGLPKAFIFFVTFSVRPTYPIASNPIWMAGNTSNSPGRDETWGKMSREVELRQGNDSRYYFVSMGTGGAGNLDVYDMVDVVEATNVTEPLSLADYIGKRETVGLFEDSGGEIMGHKFNIPRTDMTDLYTVLGTDSSALPESMMVRSVAFFRGLYLDQQELLTLLSTNIMKSSLDKTALAIKPVKAEWPQTVRMPEIINNSRFSVKMEVHGYIATAELVIGADGLPLIDSFSIAYNANLNKLDDIDMAILQAMGYSDEVIAGFTAEQLAEKLAPGSIDDGVIPFRPDETQGRALSAQGLAFEYDIFILGKLGYTYEDMIALTDKEYGFIFPNTQLIQKLIDKGYEYDIIRNKNTLRENGYDSYKELIKEALVN